MKSPGLEAEEKVRQILEIEFGKLTKQKILIGKKKKEFDLVSTDGEVVIEVKSYKLGNETTKKSGYTTTRKQRLITACTYLDKASAKTKILVLTNKNLYKQFKEDMDQEGLFPTITLRYVPTNSQDNNIAHENKIATVKRNNSNTHVVKMFSNKHKWTKEDDIIVFYLYRYKNLQPYSYEDMANCRGFNVKSLKCAIRNFMAIETGKGLKNYAKHQKNIYHRYKDISQEEHKTLVLEILSENSI